MRYKNFFERLEARAQEIDSLLCVGLDPHPDEITPKGDTSSRLVDFCQGIIEAAHPYAAAFKPNAAFFEAFGAPGIIALQEVIALVPADIPVILDAKRGDIASTAASYAWAAFVTFDADAVTVSPYLGRDSIEPFLKDPEKGAFLLCKTSNPGSADLQNLPIAPALGEQPGFLYERVAGLGQALNQNGNLGLVAGATYPHELARIRELAPNLWILAPGIGAQGGDLEQTLRAGLRPDGLGLLINVSRAISRADHPAAAAASLHRDIQSSRNAVLAERGAPPLEGKSQLAARLRPLADALLESGCVRFGKFTLKSGLQSPIYMDLRQLVSSPRLLAQVAEAYLPVLRGLSFVRLAALPYAALPIATAISLQGGWPVVYPRKEAKTYGTRVEIEGIYAAGERVAVVDDLATTGSSKFEAIDKLLGAGLEVSDVVVLIDRQSGASAALDKAGYHLHSVFTLTSLLDHWELSGRVVPEEIEAAREFIQSTRD